MSKYTVQNWVGNWQMEFNPSKREVLHFKRLNVRGKYTVNNMTVNSIDYRGFLGSKFIAPGKSNTNR